MGSVLCIGEKQLAIEIPAQRLCWLLGGFTDIIKKNIELGTKSLKVPGTSTQRGNEDQDGKHCVAFPGLRNPTCFSEMSLWEEMRNAFGFSAGKCGKKCEARWALIQDCA